MVQTGELDKQTHERMDGHFQVHYFPRFAVDNYNQLKRNARQFPQAFQPTKYLSSSTIAKTITIMSCTIWGGPKSHAFVYITDSKRLVGDRGKIYIGFNPYNDPSHPYPNCLKFSAIEKMFIVILLSKQTPLPEK